MRLVHTRKLFEALRGIGSDMANEWRSLSRSRSRSVNSKRKRGEAELGPFSILFKVFLRLCELRIPPFLAPARLRARRATMIKKTN